MNLVHRVLAVTPTSNILVMGRWHDGDRNLEVRTLIGRDSVYKIQA
jgi:hypothetical protein